VSSNAVESGNLDERLGGSKGDTKGGIFRRFESHGVDHSGRGQTMHFTHA